MRKILENLFGGIKFLVAFILINTIYKSIYKEHCWLICEKPTEARDNGYHFFKYLKELHNDVSVYYIITKNAPDLEKINQYGNIIFFNSLKHYMYYLGCDWCISSQSIPYPCSRKLSNMLYFLRRKRLKTVWLQHGITKDRLPHENMDYSKFQYDLLCCASERECDFIRHEYGYPNQVARTIGFCRYDNLSSDHLENIVLLMPTFRSWLVTSDQAKKASDKECRKFQQSDFYKEYSALLNSPELIELLKKKQYKLICYPHYGLQSYIEFLRKTINQENVIFADRMNYDVQDLLVRSKVLITDYSSVFFDFAYMDKPEIFYQFDQESYRKQHYQEGYFSYEKDAFGRVVFNRKDLIEELKEILDHGAQVADEYHKRKNQFFTVNDRHNCERTYNAMIQMK